jgi:hypothetical protein
MRRPGPIHSFLAGDHERLGALLARAASDPRSFDAASFAEFRSGILRHIAMEERILSPAARRANGGRPLPMTRRLRVEHGAIAILLVPTPGRAIVEELRSIFSGHHAAEEDPSGHFDLCDRLLAGDAEAVVERMRRFPAVRVAPHYDGPGALRTAEEALRLSSRQTAYTGDRPTEI